MPRTKINHVSIDDDSLRQTAFKKRCNGLLKQVKEISILCGLDACAVIFGPHDAAPAVHPNLPEATVMLQTFTELPEIKQRKKMMIQETYLEEKLYKSLQQYQKVENQIQKIHSRMMLYEFMSGGDMNELDVQVARKVYQTAGSMKKIGYEWMMTLMEKGGNPSEGEMRVPTLTNEDFNLDDAIASYLKEMMMQDQIQIVSSNSHHPNQKSGSNVNQQLMVQQPVINYRVNDEMMHQQAGMSANVNQQLMIQKPGNNHVENEKQKMVVLVPYANDQMMHQQASMTANVTQPMASEVHANGSNMGTGNQEPSNMDEGDLFGMIRNYLDHLKTDY